MQIEIEIEIEIEIQIQIQLQTQTKALKRTRNRGLLAVQFNLFPGSTTTAAGSNVSRDHSTHQCNHRQHFYKNYFKGMRNWLQCTYSRKLFAHSMND